MDQLLPVVMEVGEKNLKCMALLDKANTESYGTPVPVTVPLTVEKGPFIVISGAVYNQLSYAAEEKLCGPCIHNSGGILSRDDPYWGG